MAKQLSPHLWRGRKLEPVVDLVFQRQEVRIAVFDLRLYARRSSAVVRRLVNQLCSIECERMLVTLTFREISILFCFFCSSLMKGFFNFSSTRVIFNTHISTCSRMAHFAHNLAESWLCLSDKWSLMASWWIDGMGLKFKPRGTYTFRCASLVFQPMLEVPFEILSRRSKTEPRKLSQWWKPLIGWANLAGREFQSRFNYRLQCVWLHCLSCEHNAIKNYSLSVNLQRGADIQAYGMACVLAFYGCLPDIFIGNKLLRSLRSDPPKRGRIFQTPPPTGREYFRC